MKVTCAVDRIRELKPSALKDILKKDKKGQFLLLDVRQSCQYESGHIPKAMLVPLNELEERQKEIDRDKIVITYSRSGHVSVAAAVVLYQLGFRSLFHLDGGISNWSYGIATGLPEVVVKSTDDRLQHTDIYMEAMAVEMGFKSPHHFRNNKTLGRARKAVINLFKKKPKLLNNYSDIRSILVLSVKLEKAYKEFCMMARDKAKSIKEKEIFQVLVDNETESIKRLYTYASGLEGEEGLPSLKEIDQGTGIVNIEDNVKVNPFVAKVYNEFADDMELLETAVEKEYVYHDFFEQSSVIMGNLDIKAMLSQLALEKKYHASTLLEQIAGIG